MGRSERSSPAFSAMLRAAADFAACSGSAEFERGRRIAKLEADNAWLKKEMEKAAVFETMSR
jgi:hypothetical protein